jgi:hypothetical protein
LRRRQFVTLLGGAAAWPLTARAQQQPIIPVIGFLDGGPADASAGNAAAFRKGLNEAGYVEAQNVTVEYHWLEGQYDSLPALMAELVRRRVAVIAAPGNTPATIARGRRHPRRCALGHCLSDGSDAERSRRGAAVAKNKIALHLRISHHRSCHAVGVGAALRSAAPTR